MDNQKNIAYNKILILNLGGLGDLLLATPALRSLKERYPKSEVSLLIVPRTYELAKDLPYLSAIFLFNKRFSFPALWQNLRLFLKLRRMRFDLLLNMRTLVSARSAFLIRLMLLAIRPGIKAGRDTNGRGKFFDIRVPETDGDSGYEMDYNNQLVEYLKAEVSDKRIDFQIRESEVKKIEQVLKSQGLSAGELLIGMHLGGNPSHRWPIKNFIGLKKELERRLPCKFVLTADAEETGLAAEFIKADSEKIINFSGRLNLKELGALIQRCDVYITNDTAPMHIAAVMKTPLIALFGAGYLKGFDPRNISENATVLDKKIECSPCNKIVCARLKCMEAISVEEVLAAVLAALKTKTP